MIYKIKFTTSEINEIALSIINESTNVHDCFFSLKETDKIMYSVMFDLHSKFKPIFTVKNKHHTKTLNYHQAYAMRSFSAHLYRKTNDLIFLQINDKISKLI